MSRSPGPGSRTLAPLLALTVLAATACSGDAEAEDPAGELVTVATGTPESAQVTTDEYLVAGDGGVVLVTADESTVLLDQRAGTAVSDGAGGIVFQRATGDSLEFDLTETRILWVPAGESRAEVLVEPPDEDQSLELIDATTIDGELSVFYIRLEGELTREGTLHRYDAADGESVDLGPIEGVELGASHTISGSVLVESYIGDPDCGTRFLDFQAQPVDVAGLPPAFANPGTCGEVPFRAALSVDDSRLLYAELVRDDEGSITHTDGVVVDLDTGEELDRHRIRPDASNWNIEDLRLGSDAILINRWTVGDLAINPLVVGLGEDGVTTEAPAPGRGAWAHTPIRVIPPIELP